MCGCIFVIGPRVLRFVSVAYVTCFRASCYQGASKSNVTYVLPDLKLIILFRYLVRFNSYTNTKNACKLLQNEKKISTSICVLVIYTVQFVGSPMLKQGKIKIRAYIRDLVALCIPSKHL